MDNQEISTYKHYPSSSTIQYIPLNFHSINQKITKIAGAMPNIGVGGVWVGFFFVGGLGAMGVFRVGVALGGNSSGRVWL